MPLAFRDSFFADVRAAPRERKRSKSGPSVAASSLGRLALFSCPEVKVFSASQTHNLLLFFCSQDLNAPRIHSV